jgi:hypothetical protein
MDIEELLEKLGTDRNTVSKEPETQFEHDG